MSAPIVLFVFDGLFHWKMLVHACLRVCLYFSLPARVEIVLVSLLFLSKPVYAYLLSWTIVHLCVCIDSCVCLHSSLLAPVLQSALFGLHSAHVARACARILLFFVYIRMRAALLVGLCVCDIYMEREWWCGWLVGFLVGCGGLLRVSGGGGGAAVDHLTICANVRLGARRRSWANGGGQRGI